MIAKAVDTKTRILDVAEKLFGENGFDGTSLRDITTAAEVNLAAVNYHFQSKDSLIDAVIARRVEPVNVRRMAMIEAAGAHPTLEQILSAFIVPVVEQDVKPIIPLLGRVMSMPDPFAVRVFKAHFAGVAKRFLDELGKAAPHLSPSTCMWRLHFTGGAMAQVLSRSHLLPEMTGVAADVKDRKALAARLVEYAAAGFRAPEGTI
jgi:AcrR family transcriptional regulator